VTDCNGKDLDFSIGCTLRDNKSIVACSTGLHAKVLERVKQARGPKIVATLKQHSSPRSISQWHGVVRELKSRWHDQDAATLRPR
jgi:hypothetical protein